jgi:hypothetical protein
VGVAAYLGADVPAFLASVIAGVAGAYFLHVVGILIPRDSDHQEELFLAPKNIHH